ncbi:DNA polymerase III subunit alpha [Mycoplasma procyoni]|uniref:DNA polymerase III subunit alpha n=1 Tax=Mycoplasma procyoni TaxID=568784 RepID=UPI00197B2980|nr:DNA polymerase III subunit alpha [Mycoplasma procyoni]MBN3534620.1 DNA polymerase III subunit alpha [Mycoplasma procyoni]
MNKITNLHTYTEFSFLDSTITIEKLFEFAKENELKTLAISDRNNMFGVPKFLEYAQKYNIKPLIGVDLDVEDYRFLIFAKNYEGFVYLSRLISAQNSSEVVSISELNNENIIIIDHPKYGIYATKQQKLDFKNYYITTNDPFEENSIYVKENKVLFKHENKTLQVLNKIKDSQANEFDLYEDFLVTQEIDFVVEKRINEIIDQINVVFPKDRNPLPKFKNEENLSSNEYLKQVLTKEFKNKSEELKKYPEAIERLKYEVSVIENLEFADYFLIIWDLIKWAKTNGIFIGPGRGSAAGSLVSYILNITEINPLKYDLIFERFLNPKRVSIPDIDIDIQDNRREELIHYLISKYGKNSVAQIVTFQTLGAKSSFKDVARVMGVSASEANEITKLIDSEKTLEESFETNAKLKAKINSNEVYREVYEIAKKLQGLPRQHGTHAAGIIISDQDISSIIPVLTAENGILETQFSMEYLEKFGLLKVDLLGLRNLTVIQEIIDILAQKTSQRIAFENIPTYDIRTNALLSNAKTNGIFQLESPGMKKTLKQVGINSLEDVVATISLFRPGPLKNIPTYAKRKANLEQTPSISEDYDQIVAKTYGIIIYQEQIMQIAQKVAGMSFAEADILRKAISKKDHSQMIQIKQDFFDGALSKGYKQEVVEKIFEQIELFAEYGFNKSHAVAYAVLAYKMAYLKTNYAIDFYTSLINNANGAHETVKKYVEEAQSLGFIIHPPKITVSERNCVVLNDKEIYLPLTLIKGLGVVALNDILEIRSKKPFISFRQIIVLLKVNKVGDAIIKTLINANTFSDFGSISQLLMEFEGEISNYIKLITEKDSEGNLVINEEVAKVLEKNSHVIKKPEKLSESEIELLQKNEYNYLGMVFARQQTKSWEGDVKLDDLHPGNEYVLAAQVVSKKEITDKNGRLMGVLEIKDSSKAVSAFVFYSQWPKINHVEVGKVYEFKILLKNDRYSIYELKREIYEK